MIIFRGAQDAILILHSFQYKLVRVWYRFPENVLEAGNLTAFVCYLEISSLSFT